MTAKEQVFLICAKILEVELEKINEELSPSDVEHWDSMLHLTLIMAVEAEFNLSLTDQQMMSVGCVGDLVGLVE